MTKQLFPKKRNRINKYAAKSSFLKYLVMLTVSIIVGMILLIAVYLLPVREMKANVARSSEIFNYERIYPQIVHGYQYMRLDNYTDSIMLGAAIYDGTESLLLKAVNNYHIGSAQIAPDLAMTNYANEVSAYEYNADAYPRYWHGYLVPLKLLLLFFDYGDIRILNFFLQSFLLCMIIRKLYRIKMEAYAPAFMVMIFVLNPMTTALSLQYSSIYYITLFSTLWLLHLIGSRKVEEQKWNSLFFITGIATSYFDFLTYPLVPFGVLFVCYLIVNGDKITFYSTKTLLHKAVLWGCGYAGMWSGKWILGSLLIRKNLFEDALCQVLLRMSAGFYDGKEGYTRLDALFRNIGVLLKWPFAIAILCGGGWLLLSVLQKKITAQILWSNAGIIFWMTGTAVLPVGWLLVTSGHAYGHYYFTYKEFGVSAFALFCLGIYLKNLIYDEKT